MTPEAEAALSRALELASRIGGGVDDEAELVDLLHGFYLAQEELAALMRRELERHEGLTCLQIEGRRADRDERRRLLELHTVDSWGALKQRTDIAAINLKGSAE